MKLTAAMQLMSILNFRFPCQAFDLYRECTWDFECFVLIACHGSLIISEFHKEWMVRIFRLESMPITETRKMTTEQNIQGGIHFFIYVSTVYLNGTKGSARYDRLLLGFNFETDKCPSERCNTQLFHGNLLNLRGIQRSGAVQTLSYHLLRT